MGPSGGFIEKGERPEIAAIRELKEETQLDGKIIAFLGICNTFNTIFGDIILIGMEVKINDWTNIQAGDDVSDVKFFNIKKIPTLAFPSYKKMIDIYLANI